MREIKFCMDAAKTRVNRLAGESITVVVNRGRNKREKINGIIDEIHDSIFTVKDCEGKVRSFSYNDILTKSVLFFPKNSV